MSQEHLIISSVVSLIRRLFDYLNLLRLVISEFAVLGGHDCTGDQKHP